MSKSEAQSAFNNSKIIFCKRNVNGQVYAANGFREMVHFTIGNQGKEQLCRFFERNSIKFFELRGYETDMPAPPWFHVMSMPSKKEEETSPFLCNMKNKINQLAKTFIPHLMKVSLLYISWTGIPLLTMFINY